VAKPKKDSGWLLMSPPIAKLWAMEHAFGQSDRRSRPRLRRKPRSRIGSEDMAKLSRARRLDDRPVARSRVREQRAER